MFDLRKCDCCPRMCGADRTRAPGRCGERAAVRVARAAPHFWEEPPISGTRGSGTVFFSGCSLGCVYCQNRAISRGGRGKTLTVPALCETFAALEKQGVHNLNMVTPTHFTPQIIEAVRLYRAAGGCLPVVWNTGGYERCETVAALRGVADIFLTDLKYAESETAALLSRAADYPAVARAALAEMVRVAGEPVFSPEGLLTRGVLVRLLVLPGYEYEAMMNLRYLHDTFGGAVLISLMNQYTPVGEDLPPALRAPLDPAAYRTVTDYAAALGLQNVYVQEPGTANTRYIPPFEEETL